MKNKKFAVKHLFHCKLFFFTARFCASLQSFGFFTAKSFCSAANFWHFKKGFRLFHCKVSVFSLQGFLVPLQSLQWNQPLCQFLPKASLFLPKASPSISAESLSCCRGCYPWSLLAKGMSRPNIPLNPGPNMRNPILHEPWTSERADGGKQADRPGWVEG